MDDWIGYATLLLLSSSPLDGSASYACNWVRKAFFKGKKQVFQN